MSSMIRNPVLPGFHPDPSIVRVDKDYYIATSTFEWWPGVPVYHSTDLVHWRLLAHALTRPSQLDLRGVPDSAGVWAPSLSHADGKFWLVYTVVHSTGGGRPFKDLHNYLVTADRIEGPWSDPVYLNASGFDPSLFHDDDGRKWLVQMRWDFRPDKPRFAGIILQEFDPAANRLTGEVHTLLKKDRLIEGPNLYKRNGLYYLMLAEGGTGWEHGISMARSRCLTGPYEPDPQDSVLTARDDETVPLQKAGHGELVETAGGEWYLAHLASRPAGTGEHRRCVLGRETCLQKVRWTPDGWLRLAQGGHHGSMEVAAPENAPPSPTPEWPERDELEGQMLDPRWISLRGPADESWCSLLQRPGWLRLYGRESLHSLFEQSLLVRRLQSPRWRAETRLQFDPRNFNQSAGLIVWYDTRTHFYLRVTRTDAGSLQVGVVLSDDGIYAEPPGARQMPGPGDVCLAAVGEGADLRFFFAKPGQVWEPVGGVFDLTKVSDDYGAVLHFTGGMVGLAVQDLDGTRLPADFEFFSLEKLSEG
jgi:xylan 1,4-beta-xylosidase